MRHRDRPAKTYRNLGGLVRAHARVCRPLCVKEHTMQQKAFEVRGLLSKKEFFFRKNQVASGRLWPPNWRRDLQRPSHLLVELGKEGSGRFRSHSGLHIAPKTQHGALQGFQSALCLYWRHVAEVSYPQHALAILEKSSRNVNLMLPLHGLLNLWGCHFDLTLCGSMVRTSHSPAPKFN